MSNHRKRKNSSGNSKIAKKIKDIKQAEINKLNTTSQVGRNPVLNVQCIVNDGLKNSMESVKTNSACLKTDDGKSKINNPVPTIKINSCCCTKSGSCSNPNLACCRDNPDLVSNEQASNKNKTDNTLFTSELKPNLAESPLLHKKNTGPCQVIQGLIESITDPVTKFFRRIYRGVKNLFIWSKIIWKDRQYDHFYFFEIMEKKLELMEDYYRTDSFLQDRSCVDILRELGIARYLINRVLKSDYFDMYCNSKVQVFLAENSQWSKADMDIVDSWVFDIFRQTRAKQVLDTLGTDPDFDDNRSLDLIKQLSPEEQRLVPLYLWYSRMTKNGFKESYEWEKRDIRYVFTFIGKKIEHWWD